MGKNNNSACLIKEDFRKTIPYLIWTIIFVIVFTHPLSAEIRLPHIFSDHMVLQRNLPVNVWGWADANEDITVEINTYKVKAQADEAGKWKTVLPAMKAGGPHEMIFTGNNKIVIKDIMVGEVWLCSGQSNMGSRSKNKKDINAANYPKIRFLSVSRQQSNEKMTDINDKWEICTPSTMAHFSAVGYYFGQMLHNDLKVPVGLIKSQWGGTRIEPWVPLEGYAAVPALKDLMETITKEQQAYRENLPANITILENWIQQTQKALKTKGQLPPPPALPWPNLSGRPGKPTYAYNGMIYPLIPYTIRGVLWYQGETNCCLGDGIIYYEKMKALIRGWRKVWERKNLPFYFVQLPQFEYSRYTSGRVDVYQLPKFWEAQRASLSEPHTGMAITVDIGVPKNIHPPIKKEIARRLFLLAMANTYEKKNTVYSGPIYKSMKIEGSRIRVYFNYTGNGLTSQDDKPLTQFEIAGNDKKFMGAQAKIENDTVIVWNEKVPSPVAVRFNWHETTHPNLKNKDGLPAAPFNSLSPTEYEDK